MKKKHDIEIPITALSYLVMSIFYDRHRVASAVAAGLYVNGALIASARIGLGGRRIRGYAICVQEHDNDFPDMPAASEGFIQPFDLDMGDACFTLSRCAADRVCAFLTEMRVPFQDLRKLTPCTYLPSVIDGSKSGGSR